MGVKKQHRLVLLLVCLILIGVTVYPHIPALVKVAQAVQGELKFGAAMDQEMRIINKTFYSNDLYFGNAAGGTIGVMQGSGNLGVGMGTSTTNMRTPQQRLSVADTMAITAPSGIQYLLMGNQDSGGAGNPAIIRSANGNLEFGKGTAWIGPGGTFTSNVFFGNTGNVGIGSTAPTKKLDVVGDINFSGTLYQGGAAFQGSKWTTSGSNIYYNTGNVGVGNTSPSDKLQVNGSAGFGGASFSSYVAGTSGQGIAFPSTANDYIRIWGEHDGADTSDLVIATADNPTDGIKLRNYGWSGAIREWFNSTPNSTTLYAFLYNQSCPAGFTAGNFDDDADATSNDCRGPGLMMNASGNVGIGTTNPQKKLDIVATNSTINNTSGNLSIVPNANLLITQGNVGIGSANPGVKLDIATGAVVNSSALRITGGDFTLADRGDSFGSQITLNGSGYANRWDLYNEKVSGKFRLLSVGGSVETIAATSNGNVGIGSVSPAAKLDVGGTTSTIANVSGNLSIVPASNLIVTQGNVGIGITPAYKLHVEGNAYINGNYLMVASEGRPALRVGAAWSISGIYNGGDSVVIGTEPAYNIYLGCYGCGASNHVTIKGSDGNVGIGTRAPGASLDIGSKTDGMIPPQGTTAQRPGTPVTGTMRYNTTLGRPEYYNGTAWIAIVSPSGPVLATGGEITEIGGYRIHTFRTTGTFTVASNITADVLVVAGGGGGGAYSTTNANGGGGGGGVVYAVNQALTPAAYTVTIGRGGTGYTWNTNSCGANGANSVFGALPAAIGGGGGAGQSSCAGGAGGSGGGCSQNTAAGASNQTGAGTNITVYGNAGGSGSYTWTGCGGGGAGSAGVGGNAVGNSYPSGNGGNGITLTISGSSVCYAGGGGGGGNSSERAGKGFCGGGRGFGSTNYGDATGDDYRNYPDSLDPVTGGSRDVHGISNTGGGGGGGSYWSPNVGSYHAGSGGSGIVIVRYAIP